MLVIKRITVHFQLRVPADAHDTVERVKEVYAGSCPVARSIGGCVKISTELELVDQMN